MSNLLEITQSWIDSKNKAYKHVFIMDDKGRGNVTVELCKDDDGKHIGYIANLWVKEEYRKQGLAKRLLQRAEEVAKSYNCEFAVLDWALRNSPYWVYDWYERNGYEEKEFGQNNARMYKKIQTERIEFNKDNPLRVFESFAGYGSQSLALEQIKQDYEDFDYTVVGISEIDKYAIQAYNALHPNVPNYGDICTIDWTQVPDFDLLTYSFPCTDISLAGQLKGLEENSGTRSSLLWECRKAIVAKKPKYLLMENVKSLTQRKFLPYLQKWQKELESYGYTNFTQVLNAKDYGIPQNRERVFMVSILDCEQPFSFPKPFQLDKTLADVVEKEVDDKYYLSSERVNGVVLSSLKERERGNGFKLNVRGGQDIATTITNMGLDRKTDTHLIENED